MKKIILSLLILLGCAAIGAYFWQQNKTSTAPAASSIARNSPASDTAKQSGPVAAPAPQANLAATAAAAPVHHPVDARLHAAALPALDASDPMMRDALSALLGKTPVQQMLRTQEIVRRIVVTIDNLPRANTAARLLPTRKVEGALLTEGAPANITIAPQNAARYTPYAYLADLTDAKGLVGLYARHYPLFQRAYQDLGYPDGYFNDRLILVIDHLLATPDASGPLALTQPHVLYEFADPTLQARSAGQKVLLRIGSANAARIKAKLGEIRAALIEKMPAVLDAPT